MNVKERIKAFNEENRPFYLVDHEDGKFSLCLPLDLLRGEYEDFGQAAFDAYAIEIGEPPVDSRGFQTHGNGYEWEAAFLWTETICPCSKNTAQSSKQYVRTPKSSRPLYHKALSAWSNGLQNKRSS